MDQHETDLCYSMVDPRHVHLVATKHVMRCLNGTLDWGLIYAADSEFRLYGYTDSHWEGIPMKDFISIWDQV